jgi:transcriptional regulator with XRE-family HTH domain
VTFAETKPSPFPTRLRALREAAGLSVAELADRAGLSREAVRLYEAGRRDPAWSAVQRLADALNASTEDLRDR